MTKIRLVIADDHPVIIAAFRGMIAAESDLELVGSFANGTAAIDFLSRNAADILILDLSLPRTSGVSVMAALEQLGNRIKVVVWTAGFEPAEVLSAVQQGASAVVLKQMPPEYLLRAIRRVSAGASVDAESIRRSLDEIQQTRRDPADPKSVTLSRREIEVGSLVAAGSTNAEIAQRLGVGIETVKTHLQNAYAKLGVATRAELSVYIKEKGLI